MVRAEQSRLCIYAFVETQVKDQEVKYQAGSIANLRDDSSCALTTSSVRRID